MTNREVNFSAVLRTPTRIMPKGPVRSTASFLNLWFGRWVEVREVVEDGEGGHGVIGYGNGVWGLHQVRANRNFW